MVQQGHIVERAQGERSLVGLSANDGSDTWRRAVGLEGDRMKGVRVAVRKEHGLEFLFMLVVGGIVAPGAGFSHGEFIWIVMTAGA